MELNPYGDAGFPLFSVIIPVWNAERYLHLALGSVFAQSLNGAAWELIVVDDCSTDGTRGVLETYRDRLSIASTPCNSGPGIARNVGIAMARGQWLVFLDSDDQLAPTALEVLAQRCESADGQAADVIGYDWAFLDQSGGLPASGMRRDHRWLKAGREELIRRYLRLQTDGSVIFSAVRRSLVLQHHLCFAAGLHEDVDFLFQLYWHARGYRFIDQVLYGKTHRPESIVNTFDERHIEGFLRAWRAIGNFLGEQRGEALAELRDAYRIGFLGLVATRIREVFRSAPPERSAALCRLLYDRAQELAAALDLAPLPQLKTRYGMLASAFFATMGRADQDDQGKAQALQQIFADLQGKSWSCAELHHSVFLGPDQIRTCCKRFFHEGEMRGDVVLLELSADRQPDAESILAAKQGLIDALNRGDATACDGCPFLQYKVWEALEPLDLHYLSLEQHSVCNLRCSYCSETYYGGKRACYDVQVLVRDLIACGALKNCQTVVWGGGEPVADQAFTPLLEHLLEAVPGAAQRVLTNSVKFSPTVERLLGDGRISITTSVDAGSAETFLRVRGRARLTQVMCNLKRYAAVRPRRVTIKYIFTKENSTLDEVRAFVERLREFDLLACNIQISSDFKEEHVSLESAVLMICLHGLLARAGVKVIFFDDLLRIRLGKVHADSAELIRRGLRQAGLEDALVSSKAVPCLVIWGAGLQARYLVENSLFFREAKIEYFVDDTPGKVGSLYLGHPVRAPRALLDDDLPVLIAAVQAYPLIYEALLRLGVDESRLVSGLVL